MKIAYAGFDLFYPALEFLSERTEIMKIFSCKTDNVSEFNTKVTRLAIDKNIEITYERITADDLEKLKSDGCEALICAGYYYLIPVVESLAMVNIHPALLPIGRGAWPMPVTILNNMKKSGVTFHKMESSFDSGDILMQRSFDVADDEDLDSFMGKVYALLPDMLSSLISDFDYYCKNAKKQTGGEYWDCPDPEDYVLTADTEFLEADRVLRAFMGFECIYSDSKNKYALMRAKAVKGENKDRKFPIKDGYIAEMSFRQL